jgi:hypothetical protein
MTSKNLQRVPVNSASSDREQAAVNSSEGSNGSRSSGSGGGGGGSRQLW